MQNKKDELFDAYREQESENEALKKKLEELENKDNTTDYSAENEALKKQLEELKKSQEQKPQESEKDKELETLKAQMAEMMKALESKDSGNVHKTDDKVDPDEYIQVMNLCFSELPSIYQDGDSILSLRGFGDVDEIKFSDLKKIKRKYKRWFEELEVKVLDPRAVKELRLERFYEGKDIEEDTFDELCKQDKEILLNTLNSWTKPLKISFLTFFVHGAIVGKEGCYDLNKQDALNKFYGLEPGAKIAELVQRNKDLYLDEIEE